MEKFKTSSAENPADEKRKELDKKWDNREVLRKEFEEKYKPVVEQMLSEYTKVIQDDEYLSSDVMESDKFIAAHKSYTFESDIGKVTLKIENKK